MPWTRVNFKNAGPDKSLRVPYTDKDGKRRLGNMGTPWQRAASLGHDGRVSYRNISEDLQKQGFVRTGLCAARFQNFTGPCIEYRVQFYGVFRYSWFLRKSGVGYATAIYWDFVKLRKLVNDLEKLLMLERRYLTDLNRKGRNVPSKNEFDHASAERNQYRHLFNFLVRVNPLTGMSFIAIPGFEYVSNESNRALFIRLYKLLCEWYVKLSDSRGPKPGSRLPKTDLKLIKQSLTSSPTAIATKIATTRELTVSKKAVRPSEALVKQVRRAMNH